MAQLINKFNQLFTTTKTASEQRVRHYDFDGAYRGM
ncbi:hypothetical protein SAMN06295945_1663 [Polynucleobacter meluiroseus]|uniref:Uncharacterized protein n=1 Tax=Polynucleobacter meluiroseus TaxID=1938814 RepID=A0A240E2Y9_9BURK|nr:hypothetical protein SAMN06295945_1663 [Polynucleobacter meluiroseus]